MFPLLSMSEKEPGESGDGSEGPGPPSAVEIDTEGATILFVQLLLVAVPSPGVQVDLLVPEMKGFECS